MMVLILAYILDLTEGQLYISNLTHSSQLPFESSSKSLDIRLGTVDNQDIFCVLLCLLCSTMLAETAFMTAGPSNGLIFSIFQNLSSYAGLTLISYPVLADLSKLLSGELLVRVEWQVGAKGGQTAWKGHNVFLCQRCYPSLKLHTPYWK